MVSSPHRLVSSMKGGEQILSSGDRGDACQHACLGATHGPLPRTDPPPRWTILKAPARLT